VGLAGHWQMVFNGEFSGDSPGPQWTVYNGWEINNTVASSSNVRVQGGNLVLTLSSKTSGAAVGSAGFRLKVGEYVEASIEFPGNGSTVYDWPAWWVSGPGWPNGGENDIAEGLGTLTADYHGSSGTIENMGTVPGDWADSFHTYGLYRAVNYCQVYYDGRLVRSYRTKDNGAPETLLLTIGAANKLRYGSHGQMVVKYVRAWTQG
jgi:beta-glucanase (GH16 family)